MTRYGFPALIDALGITRGVEIGVSKAHYSQHLLRESKRLTELWGVDNYGHRRYGDEWQDAESVMREFGDRFVLKKVQSVAAAKEAADAGIKFGFIHLDGQHKDKAVREDIGCWLPLLDRPGIFSGHDYVAGREKFLVNVIPAVNDLAERLQMPLYITAEKTASWFFLFGEPDESPDRLYRKPI
jgi:hypothetical protein